MALDYTIGGPTRFPGGLTNVTPVSPLAALRDLSPVHSIMLGWGYDFVPGLPTGNTPATNSDYTVTSVTSTGTASLNADSIWPPAHLLTTGTTANDQVYIADKRSIKKNLLTSFKTVVIAGMFQVTSTVANAKGSFGLFSGTSQAALGNDEFGFSWSGATLNFLAKNNGGTTLTTAISTAITVSTIYGAVAVLNPAKSTVAVWFGTIDTLGYKISTSSPQEIPAVNSGFAVASTNVPDGTNAVNFGVGAQTTAGAAATVDFGPCFAYFAQ